MNHFMVQYEPYMKSITIHQLDPQLDLALQQFATDKQLSLNKSIKTLLHQALGLVASRPKADFSKFSGVWNQKELAHFEKATKSLSAINPGDWPS
jgi:hypothetical protein